MCGLHEKTNLLQWAPRNLFCASGVLLSGLVCASLTWLCALPCVLVLLPLAYVLAYVLVLVGFGMVAMLPRMCGF